MSCLITSSYNLNNSCKTSGGLAGVYIQNFDSTTSYTIAGATATNANMITALTSSNTFYTIQLQPETATYTSKSTVSVENQTVFYDNTVEFMLYGQTQTIQTLVDTLNRGIFNVMVLDNQGNYTIPSTTQIWNVSAIEAGSGKAYGDMLGAKVTMTVKSTVAPRNVVASAAQGIITA